jgi:hypothetical protein
VPVPGAEAMANHKMNLNEFMQELLAYYPPVKDWGLTLGEIHGLGLSDALDPRFGFLQPPQPEGWEAPVAGHRFMILLGEWDFPIANAEFLGWPGLVSDFVRGPLDIVATFMQSIHWATPTAVVFRLGVEIDSSTSLMDVTHLLVKAYDDDGFILAEVSSFSRKDEKVN